MLGLGGTFIYWQCAECGCVSLQNPPSNWDLYYPPNYYSFAPVHGSSIQTRAADRLRVTRTPIMSALVGKCRPDWTMMSLAPLRRTDSILDVGCGTGQIVARLQRLGYNAVGIDPFVPSDIYDDKRLRVRKCELSEVKERYDVILLSHSLEHMPDQCGVLQHVAGRLRADGRAIVRIPLALEAWHRNRARWRELDAPRHLFLHTPKSLDIVARAAGLRVVNTLFDSADVSANARKQGERASFSLVPL